MNVNTTHKYETITLQAPQRSSTRLRLYMWNLCFMVPIFHFQILYLGMSYFSTIVLFV